MGGQAISHCTAINLDKTLTFQFLRSKYFLALIYSTSKIANFDREIKKLLISREVFKKKKKNGTISSVVNTVPYLTFNQKESQSESIILRLILLTFRRGCCSRWVPVPSRPVTQSPGSWSPAGPYQRPDPAPCRNTSFAASCPRT